jgi:hypothetical protein
VEDDEADELVDEGVNAERSNRSAVCNLIEEEEEEEGRGT